MATGGNLRERAKADRTAAILRESARLFAQRGFDGVSLEELGAAVGVTGPALYRHFDGKRGLLGVLLAGASRRLRTGGEEVIRATADPLARLEGLIAFHVRFVLTEADVIRVHDRDVSNLTETDQRDVRRLQREYVGLWVDALTVLLPDRDESELRIRAHAGFGLLNSASRGLHRADPDQIATVLARMTLSALTA